MKNMLRSKTALLLALVMVLLTGCGGGQTTDTGAGDETETTEKRELTIAVANDLQSFDPANNDSASSQAILCNMYSYLFTMDTDGNVINDLVTEYENVDDYTWSFTIRDDVTFWNGDKLTAEDVKFSIERPALDTSLRENQYFNVIKSVDVVDDTHFTVTTVEPYPALTMLLCKSGSEILPKNYIESIGGMDAYQQAPIGSGPYEFVSWTKDDSVVMKPYAGYYGGAPTDWDQVTFRVIPESSTRVAELLTGSVDMATDVPPNEWERINNNSNGSGSHMVFGPTTRCYMIMMRCDDENATGDLRVRQAVEYAIDKELICDQILQGAGHPTRTRTPKGVLGYDESLDNTQLYDPDKARELLAEAGYADGLTLKMVAPTGRYLMDGDVAQTIVAMLAEVGITVELELLEFSTYSQVLAAKTGPEMTLVAYGCGFFDASYSMNLFTQETNVGQMDWENQAYDDLFYAARSNMNQEERLEQFKQTQQIVAEELPAVTLLQINAPIAVSNEIEFSPRVDELYKIENFTKQ